MSERGKFIPEEAINFQAPAPLDFEPMQPDNPLDYARLPENDHYSNKGSHKKRSDFWKDLRRQTGVPTEVFVDKTDAYIIRRKMQRTPRDGR